MSAARINQANGRLKAARVGLKIEQIGDRLYLRGTLPPKPNSGKTKPYQQRIALGVLANPAGISFAEREAHRIGVLLATKQFNWAEFERGKAETIADWIGRFQEDYFATRERNDKTETTWEGDYLVSILDRPEGRSQPFQVSIIRNPLKVSILDRPEGRSQPLPALAPSQALQ